MRMVLACHACLFSQPSTFVLFDVPFKETGVYDLRCPHGHSLVTVIQEQKFEVLFEIGAFAILDGYYREAVTSFSASLERFYEFALRVLLRHKTDSNFAFESMWKGIKHSERQLGAFIGVWSYCFSESPGTLPDDRTKFRNDVVHNGLIPTREDAVEYGRVVRDYIQPKLIRLKAEFTDTVSRIVFDHLSKSRTDLVNSTFTAATIISISASDSTDHVTASLDWHLSQLRLRRLAQAADDVTMIRID